MKFIKTIIDKANSLLSDGHERSVKAKRNVIASFGFRGISIVISFLLVPMTISYLNPTKYGIWLIIGSIIAWFGYFDIGLGNGLRNKLAEALATNKKDLARSYVSTTYASLLLIIGATYIIFLVINPFLNWSNLLNAEPELAQELGWVAFFTFTFFALRFVFQLIGVVLTADQQPAYNNAFGPIANLIILTALFFVAKFSEENLVYIAILYGSAEVFVMLCASVYFYHKRYRFLRPNLKSINFKHFKPLASLGGRFFILQIASIIIFSTDNLIIAKILDPKEVTPYNLAIKYMGIPTLIFTIIISPLWSAVTDAYTRKDYEWIRSSINKLVRLWAITALAIIALVLFSGTFYHLWVGDEVKVPFLLTVLMGLNTWVVAWNLIFANFVNGVGKIRLQIISSIIGMTINIPISIYFADNLGMGSAGVILGSMVSILGGTIFVPIQYRKIINRKATGIWDK